MKKQVVYEFFGGPYDGDFVAFPEPRDLVEILLPPPPLVMLEKVNPATAVTLRRGYYIVRAKRPLVLEWDGER